MTMVPAVTNSLDLYLMEIRKFPILSVEEERELARRWRRYGDIEAVHTLVTSNLRFVVKIANEYRHFQCRLQDLIQEGNIGLMKAVRKFDPEKGYRLISYAVWWIKAQIQSFILRSWSMVKIGTTQAQRKLFYKLASTERALQKREDDHGEVPARRLAEELGVSEEEVEMMKMRLAFRDFSLDFRREEGEGEGIVPLDHLVAETPNQEDLIIDLEQESLVQKGVAKASAALNEKERYILEHRLLSEAPMTLQEIGDRFRISRERARQIEQATKRKLRTYLEAEGLAPAA